MAQQYGRRAYAMSGADSSITYQPIAHIETPFPTCYGVPRQPDLVPAAVGRIRLPPHLAGAADGLAGCSHVWLVFHFHLVPEGSGRNKVRPPRLGGNRRIGVFATRSPFRPNPVGISVCRLVGVRREGQEAVVEVEGVDLVDGTPILDIKPYIEYVDAVAGSSVDWVPGAPPLVGVKFSGEADRALLDSPDLRRLIIQVLSQDPRPPTHKAAHRKDGMDVERDYGTELGEVDVRWRMTTEGVQVFNIVSRDQA